MSLSSSLEASSVPEQEIFTLAVDGMGGDGGPEMVIAGLQIAADRHPGIKILLLGDSARLGEILPRYPKAASICTVRHTQAAVPMDMKPTVALRLRDSSMRVAMEVVSRKEAQGVVSAGNSGAMLALAKVIVRTMPGISRPAMAAISPTRKGDVVMLDLGANVTCDWRNLVEFAVMGEAFAKSVLGLPAPTIGLLNVGAEELKGDEKLRHAADVLRDSPLASQFHGFIEGDDITAGTTDVVVTDGFTGNVALKTGEGVLRMASSLFRQVFQSSFAGRVAYLLVRPALHRMREWLDPRRYNGAVFVGLNGVVVKSHGGTDAVGFAAAVDVAVDMVRHGFNDSMKSRLSRMESLTVRRTDANASVETEVVTAL